MFTRSHLLRTSRLFAAGALVATSAFVALAPSAYAGAAAMQVTPTTLPAGDAISVQGLQCFGDDTPTAEVGVYPGTTGGTDLPSGATVASGSTLLGSDSDTNASDWALSITIPASTPAGTYTVHGYCDSDTEAFSYQNVQIQVTAGATTTEAPTTTEACTTTTTAAPTTVTTEAPTTLAPTTTLAQINQRLERTATDPCAAPTTTAHAAAQPATAVASQPTYTG